MKSPSLFYPPSLLALVSVFVLSACTPDGSSSVQGSAGKASNQPVGPTGTKGPGSEAPAGSVSDPHKAATESAAEGSRRMDIVQGQQQACADIFHQTGQGCDAQAAQAVLETLRGRNGAVGKCYRSSLKAPQAGNVRFRITLTPDGGVGQVETLEDGFAGTPLATCLATAVRTLRFPPPGDVPCVLVHTFPFVSQEKKQ